MENLNCVSTIKESHKLAQKNATKLDCGHFMCNSCLPKTTNIKNDYDCKECILKEEKITTFIDDNLDLGFKKMLEKLKEKTSTIKVKLKESKHDEVNKVLRQIDDILNE